jgi:acylaminoacyl-peptidase
MRVSASGRSQTLTTAIKVWGDGQRLLQKDVTDWHGDFFADETFGVGIVWSFKDNKIMYVAEETKSSKPGDFEPDFGESYVGKRAPCIVVVNINLDDGLVEPNVFKFDDFAVSQPCFGPDENLVIFRALAIHPRKYGLVYCQNRQSSLIQLHVGTGKTSPISAEMDACYRCPRMTLDKLHVVCLRNTAGGPHAGCAELVKVRLSGRPIPMKTN